jgi:chromosomal replication initiator protein
MYGFVAALKTQTALAFKEALRGIDVLVIDDLQFLQGRSVQAEFCHTLNALIDAGRQVVIAADRPPSDLESLDDRVRSRLAGGLVVEMGALGEELRLEILKSRVTAAKAHHPPSTCRCRCSNIWPGRSRITGRDLEGAINRLLAHNKLKRPAGDAGNGRARSARSGPSPWSRAGSRSRTSSAWSPGSTMSAAPICCLRAAPPMWFARARSRCISPRPDPALAARNRAPLRRPRPHHGAACRPQDRGPGSKDITLSDEVELLKRQLQE